MEWKTKQFYFQGDTELDDYKQSGEKHLNKTQLTG